MVSGNGSNNLGSGKQMAMDHFKRYFGYTFWVALEVVVFIGLPRLAVFPVAAYLLGKEEFGLFIFSLGIVMMIGKAPSAGLATGIIRHMAEVEGQAKDVLVSTGVRLCKTAVLVILSVGIVAVGIAGYFWQIEPKVAWCVIALLVHLYFWNLFDLQMARYRVERRFALRTAWYSLLGVTLFLAIAGAIFDGAVGMAWGYTLGFAAAHTILSCRQGIIFTKSAYDVKSAALLKHVWFHVTVAAILGTSTRYIYRIVLGIFHSYSSVAVFFGATNIIALSMGPMSILSQLLLSMLAGFSRLEAVGKRQRHIVLAAAVSIAIGAPLTVLFAGPFILSVMFPGFAEESAQILRWLVMAIPCTVVIHFSMPFIVRFAPVKFIPMLNIACLLAHLLPCAILIPKLGIKGAVISYNIGYGLSAISYIAVLAWTFKFGRGYEPDVESGWPEDGELK